MNKDRQTFMDACTKSELMIAQIGGLYRSHSVVVTVCDRTLVNISAIDIIKAHSATKYLLRAKNLGEAFEGGSLSVFDTAPLLSELAELRPAPSRIDLGKLSVKYHMMLHESKKFLSVRDFLKQELAPLLASTATVAAAMSLSASSSSSVAPPLNASLSRSLTLAAMPPQNVILYGFGRIGRLLARMLIEKTGGGEKMLLRAVVLRKIGDLAKRASLLRRDSVHGPFGGSIHVDAARSMLIANGVEIQFIEAAAPDAVDYRAHGIDDAIVVDNTGAWRDRRGLMQHVTGDNGVRQVLLTAPSKDDDVPNVVAGVNDGDVEALRAAPVLAAASCTTNAVAPVLQLMHAEYGIEQGDVQTVHSYTSDQHLIDNYHSKERRGRAAPLNMVLTESGVEKAISRVLPQLVGKVSGQAIRVPTADVSLAIISLQLTRPPADAASLNDMLCAAAMGGPLQRQIDFRASPELASTDFIGSKSACVIDSLVTSVKDARAIVYAWYDNEYGYSAQVVRLLQLLSRVEEKHPRYPLKW